MIGRIHIKVCGITRAADAIVALAFGADYLGVNCWAGSPRFVPAARRAQLLREIPADHRVAVTVNPSAREAMDLIAEGFSVIQAHFDPTAKDCEPLALSRAVGKNRLWLAPKIPTGTSWPTELLTLAAGFVHDAHSANAFGGTGKQSDWTRFQQLIRSHPENHWILAGGLSPSNVVAATEAGATFLDLNSGIELSPGIKSAEKMAEVRGLLLKTSQS